VSDEAKRQNERAAETGDPAAAARVLHERVRDGSLLPWRLELAAYAGDDVAFEALSPAQKERLVESEWFWFRPNAESLWEVLERASLDVRLRVVLDALRRGFERIGRVPIISGRLREIKAWLGRVPTPEELRVLRELAEEARDATLIVTTYEDHAGIVDTIAALGVAVEGKGPLRDAFMAAMRLSYGRDVQATVDSLKEAAPEIHEDLASYVGSPGARVGKRPPCASLHRWLMGLDRFHATVALRALLAFRRGEIRDPDVLRRLEAWVAEPSPCEVTLVSPVSGREYKLVHHPLGLPDAESADKAQYFMRDSGRDVRDEAGSREIIDFALSDEPLFRFDGLEVLEEAARSPSLDARAYRAIDSRTGEQRLLLALDKPVREARLREIVNPLLTLDHPNLARLVHVGFKGAGARRPAYLVYARALGVRLREWLAGERSLEEKLVIIGGILDGLEHAHSRGVFHRRLFSESIVVDRGEARIVDHGHKVLGRLGDTLGTTLLEIDVDQANNDSYADVYGAAALAAMVLTGRPVFRPAERNQTADAYVTALARAIRNDPPPPVGHRDSILRRALAPRREDRFSTVAAFRAAFLD
jgi:hypothetical protein